MKDYEIRLRCMDMAVKIENDKCRAVEAAQAFYDFVNASDSKEVDQAIDAAAGYADMGQLDALIERRRSISSLK